jgi:hypothetical protein
MLWKLKKWLFFLVLNLTSCYYGILKSQQLVCVNFSKLETDGTDLHDYDYPYLRINKTINSVGNEKGIVVYFQDFYKYLLYDIDTLNFELIYLDQNLARTIKVPVNEKFQLHKVEPKFQINSFYVVNNRLYLLVFNTLYEYKISSSKVCQFLKSYEIDKNGFEWFCMVNKNTGIFFRSSNEINKDVQFIKFKIEKKSIVLLDSLRLPFDGMKYLRSESSFISDDNNVIVLGNAASSKVFVIDKKYLNVKKLFYHSNLVKSGQIDTLNYKNKFDFHNSIHSDSINYHYQTCYFSGNTMYRSRSKIVGKYPHFLDVYRLTETGWDSIQTLCEGLYNFKKFRDSTEKYSIMHFDPMSSVCGRIAINGSLYSVGLSFETEKCFTKNNIPFYKFPISELRTKGKSVFENKKYNFTLYEYKIVD